MLPRVPIALILLVLRLISDLWEAVSPSSPGGRAVTPAELKAIAEARLDEILDAIAERREPLAEVELRDQRLQRFLFPRRHQRQKTEPDDAADDADHQAVRRARLPQRQRLGLDPVDGG